MFPNVRLLIGALFIAVVVLSCEFGVFAALRVNREPLNRLTAEGAPLQRAAGNSAQPAVTISWATPLETGVPAADAGPPALIPPPAAAPIPQAPAPPAFNAAAMIKEPTPAQSGASATLALAAIAPVAAQPPQPAQPAPEPQAHQSVAKAGEPAAGAPVAAAPAAALAPAAQPADITGSVPNAATPDPALPKAAAPLAEASPKVTDKPVKKARKAARLRHATKRRVVRRAWAPAAASSGQPAGAFDNPVFQSAQPFQSPARNRAGAKKAATNNGLGNRFGTP
jgi:hypothetical protein